jgi:hypothetical protein
MKVATVGCWLAFGATVLPQDAPKNQAIRPEPPPQGSQLDETVRQHLTALGIPTNRQTSLIDANDELNRYLASPEIRLKLADAQQQLQFAESDPAIHAQKQKVGEDIEKAYNSSAVREKAKASNVQSREHEVRRPASNQPNGAK